MQFIFLALFLLKIINSADVCGDNTTTGVTYCDLDVTLRVQMQAVFDDSSLQSGKKENLPPVVRLIFHDCMGPKEGTTDSSLSICDGCIDLTNDAHAGLEQLAVNVLEPEYQRGKYNWKNRMSRADFYAAVATIAVQYAATLAGGSLPFIPFYIGRTDCSFSPDVDDENTPTKTFPSPTDGWTDNFNFFANTFGYDEQEYVAILGAHTLGRVHSQHSGFGTDPWVRNWDHLNNAFYRELLDETENWQQQQAAGGKYEWKNMNGGQSNANFVMLNSDMALVLDLDSGTLCDDTTGQCNCTYWSSPTTQCQTNSVGKTHVENYEADNQLWLTDFAAAFRKMILTGYDNVNPVPNDLMVVADDAYYAAMGITRSPTPAPTPRPTRSPTPPTKAPTQLPTRSPTTALTCTSQEDWDHIFSPSLDSWDEATDGAGKRVEGIDLFLDDPNTDCGTDVDVDLLEYWYRFKITEQNNGKYRIRLFIRVCCPFGETFGEPFGFNGPLAIFWKPNEVYLAKYPGSGSFVGDDNIYDEEGGFEFSIKYIISICILFITVVGVCGLAVFCYKKKRKQRKEKMKQNDDEKSDDVKIINSIELNTKIKRQSESMSNGVVIYYTKTNEDDDMNEDSNHDHSASIQGNSTTSLV